MMKETFEFIISMPVANSKPFISRFSMMYGSPNIPEPLHQSCVSAQVQLCAPAPVAKPSINIGACNVEAEQSLFSMRLPVHQDSKRQNALSFKVLSVILL